MDQITITKTSLHDLAIVQQISKETFFETYSAANTPEAMEKYMDQNFTDDKIKVQLGNPESQFFIAWDGGEPSGYLKVNSGRAQTELQDPASLEIERIYVKKAYQGKKVGQMLYEKAIEVAQSDKKTFIWLGVWEENPKAIRFYEKNGFVAFEKHIFMFGEDEQTDIMMKKFITY